MLIVCLFLRLFFVLNTGRARAGTLAQQKMHRSLEDFKDYIGVTRPLAELFSECTDGALVAILPSITSTGGRGARHQA